MKTFLTDTDKAWLEAIANESNDRQAKDLERVLENINAKLTPIDIATLSVIQKIWSINNK